MYNKQARDTGSTAEIIGITLVGFALLYQLVRKHKIDTVDLRVSIALQKQRNPVFRLVMAAVSWPGFPPQSRVIPLLLPLFWLARGNKRAAVFQLLAWGSGGLSSLVKRFVRRERPNHPLLRFAPARIKDTSFPSGHTLIYIGVYGFFAYLANREPDNRWKKPVTIAISGLLAAIGPSRIHLGHHWFSDVSASYLLGASYLTGLAETYNWISRRWPETRGG